ncbi:MAG TPA: prolyl oligopeptidase family serine peptidase, partial [Chitinophagaceae bacterium]
NDNKTLFYNRPDNTVRSYKVMKHTLGTDPGKDEEVYTENDNTFTVYVSPSLDNKYIFIFSNSTEATEARYIDASNTTKAPVLLQPRSRGLLYYPAYYGGDVFYIRTNKDAKNFKLASAPISNPGIENWKDVVPHKKDEYFQGYYVLKNFLVTQTKKNGLNQISYTDWRTNKSFNIAFGEDAYVASMYLPTDELSSDSIRFFYSSLTTPSSEFGYNLTSQKKNLLKKQQVGGGYTSGLYETKRIWSKATDGTMIPSTIVYRRDRMKKDGSNPMLLYAYGSYGANSEPYFNSSIISLLDRGFIYGIAHIRGGQELGREWYESGRQLKKKNTFTDFIDVAQYLVNEKYTSANRLFANGVSAGGMLMGAITNMRPDLFRGIIAEVPWMDVISDSFDPTIPLVSLEWDEWGNPGNKEVYDYMLTWSPMENVKKANYPAILATGGLHDTQVPYYSPAKWVAKVREHNLGNNPVLLKTNMGAGHGGESGRFERQKLTALKFAFALNLLGWNEVSQTYSLPKQF